MLDLITRLKRRVDNLTARAVLYGVNAALKLQEVQVVALEEEGVDGAEHVEGYGMTAHPPIGAEAILLFLGGYREHPIALTVFDRRYRPKDLLEGEVALYSKFAQLFKLTKDGDVICTAPRDIIFAPGRDFKASAGRDAELDSVRDTHVRGTARFIYECNGHGWVLKPDRQDSYTIGAVAGANNAINPPHIP